MDGSNQMEIFCGLRNMVQDSRHGDRNSVTLFANDIALSTTEWINNQANPNFTASFMVPQKYASDDTAFKFVVYDMDMRCVKDEQHVSQDATDRLGSVTLSWKELLKHAGDDKQESFPLSNSNDAKVDQELKSADARLVLRCQGYTPTEQQSINVEDMITDLTLKSRMLKEQSAYLHRLQVARDVEQARKAEALGKLNDEHAAVLTELDTSGHFNYEDLAVENNYNDTELDKYDALNKAMRAALEKSNAEVASLKVSMTDMEALRGGDAERMQEMQNQIDAHTLQITELEAAAAEATELNTGEQKQLQEEIDRLNAELEQSRNDHKELDAAMAGIKGLNNHYAKLVEEPEDGEEAKMALEGLAELKEATDAQKAAGTDLTLNIKARQLIKMDWLSKSDPIVGVFVREQGDEAWAFVGKTEWVKNSHDCDFQQPVTLFAHGPDDTRELKFTVFDVDEPVIDAKSEMGSGVTTVQDLYADMGTDKQYMLTQTPREAKVKRKLKKAKTHVLVSVSESASGGGGGGAPMRSMPAQEKQGVSSGAPCDDEEDEEDSAPLGVAGVKSEMERLGKLNATLEALLGAKQNELDTLNDAKTATENDKASLAEQLAAVEAAKAAVEADKASSVSDLEQQLEQKNQEADALATERDGLADDKTALTTERDALLAEQASMNEAVSGLGGLTNHYAKLVEEPEDGEEAKMALEGLAELKEATDAQKAAGTDLTLNIKARQLIKMDWLSKSDPIVGVFVREQGDEAWAFVGKTEWVKNSHDCDFQQPVTLFAHGPDDTRELKFTVFDVDEPVIDAKSEMGSGVTTVQDLYADMGTDKQYMLTQTPREAKVKRKLKKAKTHVLVSVSESASGGGGDGAPMRSMPAQEKQGVSSGAPCDDEEDEEDSAPLGVAGVKSEMERLGKLNATLEALLGAKQNELDTLNDAKTATENDKASLAEQLAAVEAAKAAVEADKASNDEEQTTRIAELEQQQQEAAAREEDLNQQVTDSKGREEDLTSRLNALQQEKDQLGEDKQAEEARLNQDIDDLKAQLAQEQADREAKEQELADTQTALAELAAAKHAAEEQQRGRISDLEQQLEQKNQEADALATERDGLLAEQASMNEAVSGLGGLTNHYAKLVEEPEDGEEAKMALEGLAELKEATDAQKAAGTDLTLNIKARQLIKMDWLSKSDPIVGVFVREQGDEAWAFVGKTEWVKNSHDCDFQQPVTLFAHGPDDTRELKFTVFDVDEPVIDAKSEMGSGVTTVQDLYADMGTDKQYMLTQTPREAKVKRKLKKAKTHVLVSVSESASGGGGGGAPMRSMPAQEKQGVSSGAPCDDEEDEEDSAPLGVAGVKSEMERLGKLNATLEALLGAKQNELDTLNDAKTATENDMASLAEQLAAVEAAKAAVEADKASNDEEQATRIAELEQQQQEAAAREEDLNQQVTDSKGREEELAAAKDQLAQDKEAEETRLNSEVEDLKAQNATLTADKAATEQALADSQAEVNDALKLFDAHNKRYSTLVEEPEDGEEAKMALEGLAELKEATDAQKAAGTDLTLNIKARQLIKMDWLSKSDPIVGVFVREQGDEAWAFVGKTEWVKNSHDCDFQQPVTLFAHGPDDTRELKFTVFDVDEPVIDAKSEMGSGVTTVQDLYTDMGTDKQYMLTQTPREAKVKRKLKKAKTHVLVSVSESASGGGGGGAPMRSMPAQEKQGVSSGAPCDDEEDEEDSSPTAAPSGNLADQLARLHKLNDVHEGLLKKNADDKAALEAEKADGLSREEQLKKELAELQAAKEAAAQQHQEVEDMQQNNIDALQNELAKLEADKAQQEQDLEQQLTDAKEQQRQADEKAAQEQAERQKEADDTLGELARCSAIYDSLLPSEQDGEEEEEEPEEETHAIMTGYEQYKDDDSSGTLLHITLGVEHLIKMDWLSKSDPLVAVFLKGEDGAKDQFVGMTEWRKNTHDCTFDESVHIRYREGDTRVLRMAVYDLDKALIQHDKNLMGCAEVPLSQLVADVSAAETQNVVVPIASEDGKLQRKLAKKKSAITISLRSDEKEAEMEAARIAAEKEAMDARGQAQGPTTFEEQLAKLRDLNQRLAVAEKERKEKEALAKGEQGTLGKQKGALEEELEAKRDELARMEARDADLCKKVEAQAEKMAALQAEAEAQTKAVDDLQRQLKDAQAERQLWLSECEVIAKHNKDYANLLEDPELGGNVTIEGATLADSEGSTHRVELKLGVRRLIKMDWLSKSDPLIAIFVRSPGKDWAFVGKTEFIKNSLEVDFHRVLYLDHKGDQDQREVKISVYDVDGNNIQDKDLMGQNVMPMQEFLGMCGQGKKEVLIAHPNNAKLNKLMGKKKSAVALICNEVGITEETNPQQASQAKMFEQAEEDPEASYATMKAQLHQYEVLNVRLRGYFAVENTKREGFNLSRCVAYTKATLQIDEEDKPHFNISAFLDGLETKYRHVDADESGLITYGELREAVWNNEEDNEGLSCPDGDLPPALQEVVDDIHTGTGKKDVFSFWDFVPYMLGEEGVGFQPLVIPPANQYWAHAKGIHEL